MLRHWQVALVITFITSGFLQIPYILGYAFARPNTEFTGILVNLEDASYLSIISQGIQGAWQYHNPFTPEPHAPAFLYGFYLGLGHLARILNISNVTMWHVARIVASLLLFISTYGFIGSFIGDLTLRWVAYLLAIFGAGFDWVVFPFEHVESASGVPVDFKMPEAHLFFSALTYPHFSIGIVLILGSFWLALRAFERNSWRYAIAAGIVNLLLGIVYPFLMYLVVAVLGTYWVYSSWLARKILWRGVFIIAIVFAIPAPLYAYYQYVLLTNSVFKIWDSQAITLSPNPLHYLLTYGVMIMLGIASWRHKDNSVRHNIFLWLWLAAAAILLYVPLNAQRRFVEGLQIPLAILATAGLFFLLSRFEQTRLFRALASRPNYSAMGLRRMFIIAFLSLMGSANVVILLQLSAMTALEQPDLLFRPVAELQAMDWLRDHTTRDDIVLASYPTASYIPARSGNSVFVGQRYETNYFEDKLKQTEIFFNSKVEDKWRRDLIVRYRISYVFVGPRERLLGGFDSARADFLQTVFSNSAIQIFSVQIP